MFAQVIVGTPARRVSFRPAPESRRGTSRRSRHYSRVNCLTLMRVVIVKFLTVLKGHVGEAEIPGA